MSATARTATVVLAAALLVAAAPPLAAQYRGEVQVEAVVAPVTVRDRSGRLVSRVDRERFHLYVDGHEVPIRDLSRESDLALSLGFVVDSSGSMAGRKMRGCQQLVMAFLAERRQEDQLALWTFGNERVLERFPFGMSWYLLPRVLETIRPWSTTALYDMIKRVPEVVEKASHPRRAVILFTDGVDNASEMTSEEATAIARDLETPIYALGVEPPPRPGDQTGASYEDILELIARSSGGHYSRIPRAEEMPLVVERLVEELASRFIVTFSTSGVGARQWRTIEVKVDGYDATTRRGYKGTLP